jgi:hypothetical protein
MASLHANTKYYKALACCVVSAGIHRRLWDGLIAGTTAIQHKTGSNILTTRTLLYFQRRGLDHKGTERLCPSYNAVGSSIPQI